MPTHSYCSKDHLSGVTHSGHGAGGARRAVGRRETRSGEPRRALKGASTRWGRPLLARSTGRGHQILGVFK